MKLIVLTLIISFNKAGQFFRKKEKKWSLLHAGLKSHYKAWSYKKKKEGKKIKAYRKFV